MRRRRRVLRARAGLTLAMVATAVAAGGALAQEPSPPSDETASQSAERGKSGTIAAVQRELGLRPDGVYGRRTRAAVRRFQRREGLTVDGRLGPETLAALGISDDAEADGADGGASPASDASGNASSESANATLERIAQCESGGNPQAVSADGQYRGKYQFDRATWERLGGTGDPAQASESEQDRVAATLLARSGTSPWPNCA